MRLFLLASAGLIVFEATGVPRYRYTPGEADGLLGELETVYGTNRDEVVALVEAPAPPDPIRSFADAFKLRK